MEKRDTIVAVATAAGRGAIGVVRLSGHDLSGFFQPLVGGPLSPRIATLRDFLGRDGTPIDSGLALYFPAPHSYTGEDVLELQGHGGPAVVDMVLQRCLDLGARIAAPGEYSLRAFLNGRMDLAQAEAVADLIDASTQQAARSATRSLKGEFSKQVAELIERLTALRVRVEAQIDFPEEDVDHVFVAEVAAHVEQLLSRLREIRSNAARGALMRTGATVALYGAPNVGKSSLMNRLAGDEVSIVTPIPGTTRDAIRVQVAVHGVAVEFVDTAGIRQAADIVEQMGIERTLSAVASADLTLVMFEAGQQMSDVVMPPSPGPRLLVANKSDLIAGHVELRDDVVYISAKTGDGMALLCERILERLGWVQGEEVVFTARRRHLEALDRCTDHLLAVAPAGFSYELVAEELRQAQRALREVGGEVSSDDLLGAIFSTFCIGK